MSDTVQEFQVGEAFFARLRRNLLISGVTITAISLSATVLYPLFFQTGKVFVVSLIPGVFMVVIMATAFFSAYRQTAKRYQRFSIVLSGKLLKRSLPGQEDLYIAASEISRVIVYPGAGCGVEGLKGQPAIWIPATLLGYDKLMQTVQSWRTPEIRASFWSTRKFTLLATVALLAAIFFIIHAQRPERIPATVVGIFLAAFFAWAANNLPRNAYVSEQQKSMAGMMWIGMGFVILKIATLWFL